MARKKQPKTVRVRITARQVVKYDQVKEMTVEEWHRLKAMGSGDFERHASGWIDTRDVDDAEDIEDIEAVVVDKDGEPVEPEDRYYAD